MWGVIMLNEIFITCAVTGSGQSQTKSDRIPATPKEIADSSIRAAKAGAAIAHIHVRDPETGEPARNRVLYREVVDRIRASDTDVVLNLTSGMGGDLVLGNVENPLPFNKDKTDLVGATERLAHVNELLPEICTLDCGTMNFSESDYIMVNSPGTLRAMAKQIQDMGVKPEIEIFDTGHLWFAKQLVNEGLVSESVLLQLCMGIPYGAPNDIGTALSMVNNIPKNWIYSIFSIGRHQLPYVGFAPMIGAHVRVGLEDNIWLRKGHLATNESLVERAHTILSAMNVKILNPREVRDKLKLRTF